MKDDFTRFDMTKPPLKTKWYLKPVEKLLSAGDIKKHKPIITYENDIEKLTGPFLLLCNHNAFMDFKVATTLLGKNEANYVVAIDGFIGREWLLRNVGCVCKRKFTNDITLVRQLKKVIDMGNVAVIYPEARYSLCGTTAVLPKSLGKLAKFLDVPVVTLICHGHHINSPFWDTSHDRGVVHTEATFTKLIDVEELRSMDADSVNRLIADKFKYDDFKWQKDRNIHVDDKKRCEGLHRVLYKCPVCESEHHMTSAGSTLCCSNCSTSWEMTELGELKSANDEKGFTHIPDWYEWERSIVRKEIEEGTYSSGELDVTVDSLPNAKKFIHLGKGKLIHDMDGFRVSVVDKDGDTHEMKKDVASMYSCHIEYQYLFKHGDCIDLNTLKDTWYIYPEGRFSVTKMALATEELYRKYLLDKGQTIEEGIM